VLYLEADHELSLAAYLAEFADIIGKGSLELFEQLATAVAERGDRALGANALSYDYASVSLSPRPDGLDQALSQLASRVEALQQTAYWSSDKAVLILTGNQQIWLEAAPDPSVAAAASRPLESIWFVVTCHR
jgi:hypothetical protein